MPTTWITSSGFVDLEVDFDFKCSKFIRGRYSGPPEDCYPDEGGECEEVTINKITCGDPDINVQIHLKEIVLDDIREQLTAQVDEGKFNYDE